MALNNKEKTVALENPTDKKSKIDNISTTLQEYKNAHNITNLQKLCVEVADFCRAIYASTQNEDERKEYKKILGKISEL